MSTTYTKMTPVKIPEEHLQLWPYAQGQLTHIHELVDRIDLWKKAVKEICYFLDSVIRLERRIGLEHGNLFKQLQTHEEQLMYGGDVLKAWQQYAENMQNDYTNGESQLNLLVCKRLIQLKTDVKKRLRQYQRDMDELVNAIMTQRNKTVGCIHAHEKYLNSKLESGETPGSQNPTVDPWLSERVLYKQLRVMILHENKFQVEMVNFFQDVSVFDAHVIEELKRILEEYALARSGQWSAMQTHTNLAAALATSTNASIQFEQFSEANGFDRDELWKTDRILDEFPYKANEIQILKKGLIYMPSSFGKDRWFPVMAVLTETGFLHCFKMNETKHQAMLEQYKEQNEQAVNKGWMATLKRSLSRKSRSSDWDSVYQELEKPKATFRYISLTKH